MNINSKTNPYHTICKHFIHILKCTDITLKRLDNKAFEVPLTCISGGSLTDSWHSRIIHPAVILLPMPAHCPPSYQIPKVRNSVIIVNCHILGKFDRAFFLQLLQVYHYWSILSNAQAIANYTVKLSKNIVAVDGICCFFKTCRKKKGFI